MIRTLCASTGRAVLLTIISFTLPFMAVQADTDNVKSTVKINVKSTVKNKQAVSERLKEHAMMLKRNGSQPSIPGPDAWFTGTVRIDPIQLEAQEPSRLTAALVTFEPGARSNWHTHPLGQLLIVTAGKGWTQCEGEARVDIHAGDTLWCPPGHKHWHGATGTTAMSHISVQEMLDGKNVVWLEAVTDEQYGI